MCRYYQVVLRLYAFLVARRKYSYIVGQEANSQNSTYSFIEKQQGLGLELTALLKLHFTMHVFNDLLSNHLLLKDRTAGFLYDSQKGHLMILREESYRLYQQEMSCLIKVNNNKDRNIQFSSSLTPHTFARQVLVIQSVFAGGEGATAVNEDCFEIFHNITWKNTGNPAGISCSKLTIETT